jgi:hypothetical protein
VCMWSIFKRFPLPRFLLMKLRGGNEFLSLCVGCREEEKVCRFMLIYGIVFEGGKCAAGSDSET